jgi:ADP-ribose pyrophosphatase YjhB (NUDIX family)
VYATQKYGGVTALKFEPQKFFIGLVDFFSILLPGALLTYVLMSSLESLNFPNFTVSPSGDAVAIFLFCSYLLGHFIFLLGSYILDDVVYDKLRNATSAGQVREFAKGKARAPLWLRKRAEKVFRNKMELPLQLAIVIKEFYLDRLGASAAMNTFQWSKAKLSIEQPEALAIVQRFEADSKFFRSLIVVLSGLIIWWIGMDLFSGREDHLLLALCTTPLVYLSMWRYVELRRKSINQAYWYIIALEAERDDGYRPNGRVEKDGMTHAGGVVYRNRDGKPEFLLVQAKANPNEWVLPKGHIEPWERTEETAVREVLEEARVWAKVEKKLQSFGFLADGEQVKVQFYLMEYVEDEASDEERGAKWFSGEEAIEKATHSETKNLLMSSVKHL